MPAAAACFAMAFRFSAGYDMPVRLTSVAKKWKHYLKRHAKLIHCCALALNFAGGVLLFFSLNIVESPGAWLGTTLGRMPFAVVESAHPTLVPLGWLMLSAGFFIDLVLSVTDSN